MPGRSQHKENTVIGSGECYIALMDADGNYGNERYLGDSPGASMNVETEEIEVDSSDGVVAETLVRHVTSRKYTFNLTLGDISHENIQLFTGGDVEEQAAITAPVTDEDYKVELDRWIQVGQSSSNPAGVSKMTSVTVNKGTQADPDTEGLVTPTAANLVLEEAPESTATERVYTGRIFIPPGSNLSGKWISVDYTPASPVAKRVKVGVAKAIEGSFRYRESVDPPGTAKPRDYYARLCSIRGDGINDLKSREGPQRLSLVAAVMKPAGGYPLLSIDGEAQS